ncbi:MAG: DNA alkylation repair protein [Acidimicrobiia bacterium]|nr:MAG: DNA alkylation repair protein [Acidimicrobiia bacterium]
MDPFKNVFSPQLVGCLADHLEKRVATFDRVGFEGPVLEQLESLELKARAQLIADHLHVALPQDHEQRLDILRSMLHPVEDYNADSHSDDDGIRGWGVLPMSMVVGQHGLDDFDGSLALLADMTKRFSAEFAVRFFLLDDQQRALAVIGRWVEDPSRHVRRLLSEGTRPRLPWAMRLPQLIADPSPMLPSLEALRDDEEEYVRRSVANHLNDIAKDHPDLVARLGRVWMRDADKNRERLVRHAFRTLIKDGHPAALETFGFGSPRLELESLRIETPIVNFGATLGFTAGLRSTSDEPQSLMVDYLVHFRKADGRLVGKVFKWKSFTLAPGQVRFLERSHAIRPITTRRYYTGQQGLSLRINGRDFGYAEFELHVPAEVAG